MRTVSSLKIKYDGGDFYCSDRRLTSLKGSPSSISEDFVCSHNLLTSLEWAPSFIGGGFGCSHNKLVSLEGIHKQVEHIGGSFIAYGNYISSHVLGLLLIKGLKRVELDSWRVQRILNQHLPSKGMRSLLEAQEQLIGVGLDDFAQL